MTNPTNPTNTADLRAAAQAVVDRWDTPTWKDVPATAEYIGRLRAALAAPAQAAPPASVEQEAMQMLWNDQQQEEKEHYRNVARGAERIK